MVAAAAPDLPVVGEPGSRQALPRRHPRQPGHAPLRNPRILSIFRVQHTILAAFADHLRGEGFTEIKTSKLIGTGTEGGTGLFAVDYFDGKMYLTQSPQLYKQTMVASGLERVFEIGTAYRAEKHDTPRHINEFVSLDVETAWIDSEQDLMDLETRILASVFARVRERNGNDLAAWKTSVPEPEAASRIPRVSHDEAREIVAKETGRKVYEITPEGERTLCDWAAKTAGIEGVFVYAYPRKSRPFYTLPGGGEPHPRLRPAVPGSRDHLGRHAHQPLRGHRRERESLRARSIGPVGLPRDLQVRVPAARRLRDRPRALHAEAARPREREGGEPLPARPEEDEAVVKEFACEDDG